MSKPDDSLDEPYDQPPDGPRGAQRSTHSPVEMSFSRISSLQDQLDETTQRTRSLVPPEKLAPSELAVAELFATGIEERILPVGAQAPEFSLPDAAGRMVRSTDLLALGPLVVNFFRGRWCSYCVQELEAWQRLYPLVRKQHAILIGISPQTIRHNSFAASQHKLAFPLLSDEGVWIARKFGLDYTVPDYLRRYYRSILVNIPFVNGEQSWRLPLPATYVIAQDSTILYARAYADFRVRPEPGHVLSAIPHSK
jgi:peroxiredoxin